MLGEPARGGLPEPGFYSLSGLEQVQALRRGQIPRPPLARLTGLTVTRVGPGTATLTMPASPWLEFGDGADIQTLTEAAMSAAVLSGAPGGADVSTSAVSVTQFRPVTFDAAKIIARARTVQVAPTFTFAEVEVQDDLGREVGRATGAVLVRPCDPPPPPPPQLGESVEEPAYPTPDPHERPLAGGLAMVLREEWEQLDGLGLARRVWADQSVLPAMVLFGGRFLTVDRGHALLEMHAHEWLCYRTRHVSPGVVGLFNRLVLVAAALTLAGRGGRVGVITMSTRFLGRIPADGRAVRFEAKVTEHHDDSVVSSASITDSDGRQVASGYQMGVLLGSRGRPQARSEPVLATVLFTDLVGSTALATELGDDRWRRVLSEQEDATRRELRAFGGREIKTIGDGFLATFDSPARAARCARAIRDASRRLGLEIRAGIHTGECEFARGDVTGIAVHLASRVLAVAGAGEVLVSGTVRDLLLGGGLTFEDRGRHQLKGIEGDWPLFALTD